MAYTVQQLGALAGVSVRTLHHYDAIGLLKPARVERNGYRMYEDRELLLLQQILFFRELDFSLEAIKRILNRPDFRIEKALKEQRALIEAKKNRLTNLIQTIDQTLKKITRKETMSDKSLYDGLSESEVKALKAEAKERWGHTDAYKQSQERYGSLSKEEKEAIGRAGEELLGEIVAAMRAGGKPESEAVQVLIARHYDSLRNFYEPSMEMYRGLAEMYVGDPRFAAFYEKRAEGLAQFMRDSMIAYCDQRA